VIEFQHSGIRESERRSREQFYQHMYWVIDARACVHNLKLCEPLPAPGSDLIDDLYVAHCDRHYQELMELPKRAFTFYRSRHIKLGKYFAAIETTWWEDGELCDSTQQILEQTRPHWQGHRLMLWRRPRRQWLGSTCPVFLDIGSSLLLILPWSEPKDRGYYCVQEWTHDDFVYLAAVGEPPPEQTWVWPATP